MRISSLLLGVGLLQFNMGKHKKKQLCVTLEIALYFRNIKRINGEKLCLL